GTAKMNEMYPPAAMLREMGKLRGDVLDLKGDCHGTQRQAYCPTTIAEAVAFRQKNSQAKVAAGATDVGVQLNKRVIAPEVFLDLNRMRELEGVKVAQADGDGRVIVAGARGTWTEMLQACRDAAPEFAEIVSVFGSPQIRHVGTI